MKYIKLKLIIISALVTTFSYAQKFAQLPKLKKSDYISTKCYSSIVSKKGGVCKYIKVKAEPNNKKSNRYLDIYYSIIPATQKRAHKKEPIVFLTGGPGISMTHTIPELLKYKGGAHLELLKRHDYIFIDYRGTGFSKPFPVCSMGKGDFITELNRCVEKLPKEVNTKDYTTANIAYDINEILKKEKIKKANLFGVSYGARVASTIIRDYPKRINKVVLEGLYSIEANGVSQGNEALLDKLSYLRAKYKKRYPNENFEIRLLEYLYKLDKKDRLKRVEGIAWMAFEDKAEEKLKKEFDNPSRNFGRYHKPAVVNIYAKDMDKNYIYLAKSEVMATAIMICEEYVFKDLQPSHTFGFSKKLVELTKGYSAGSPIPLNKLHKAKIKTHKKDTRDMKPVLSNIPILILSGEYDMQTPLFWAINAQKYFLNSKHFFFMGKDHGFSMNSKKAINIVDSFYNSDNLDSLNSYRSKDIKIIK